MTCFIWARGRLQRTSSTFRGGGGAQLQTFADIRGGGVSRMQTSAFKKKSGHIPHQNFLTLLRKMKYTDGWNFWGGWFMAGNQGNYQNFVPSLISKNLWRIFIKMKHFLFLEKGPKWANIEKLSFSKSLNSQNLFVKSLEIGPWICRSDAFLVFLGSFSTYAALPHCHTTI